MKKSELDKLLEEKVNLLTKVNNLLEEVLDKTDDKVRSDAVEIIRQLKDNISEIDQKVDLLKQTSDETYESLSEEEQVEEDYEGEQEDEDSTFYSDEYEYTEEPSISIGRAEDGTVLAVYDKRKKKQK